MTEPNATPARVRVWDLPTRLVHWLLVLLVVFSWWTAETGRLEWHRWSGYWVLGLVLFRIYWGFVGSSTARFSQFVRGPKTIGAYLRGAWVTRAGHNPLGALSVLALLGLLVAQVTLGLFAVDVDGIESGPLSLYVSFEAGRAAAHWHEDVFNVLTGLIVLHVLAVLYYLIAKKDNLVGPMVTGKRGFDDASVAPVVAGGWIRLLVGLILCAAITFAISRAFQF
jgi:cytochrome b